MKPDAFTAEIQAAKCSRGEHERNNWLSVTITEQREGNEGYKRTCPVQLAYCKHCKGVYVDD